MGENQPSKVGSRSPAYLRVARLLGVFGVRGELKCRPTSLGEGAILPGRAFFLSVDGGRSIVLSNVRRHHRQTLVCVQGVESVEAAQALVGLELFMSREEIVLGPDEFLDEDIVGARMFDPEGRELGRVCGVEHYPAQDCLIVEPLSGCREGRALVPLVKEFVREIDLEQGRIVMALPPGLLHAREAEEA